MSKTNQINLFKSKIISLIKKGKVQSEFDLLNFIKKQCPHFYHKNCFEKSYLHERKKRISTNAFFANVP